MKREPRSNEVGKLESTDGKTVFSIRKRDADYEDHLKIDDFFKFVVLRNPVDQLVSLYNQLRKSNPIPSLEHFVLGEKGMTMSKVDHYICLLYTSPSPRDRTRSRMPSSA